MTTSPILVHVSGGMDSAAVAVLAAKTRRGTVEGLFIDLGQPYVRQERRAARYVARRLGLVLHEHRLQLAAQRLDGQPDHYVPHRNAVIAALSVHVASVRGCREVWVGSAAEDRFRDNQPSFWWSMGRAIWRGTEVGTPQVVFRSPVATRSRADVAALLREGGLDVKRLWWCYRAGRRPCGRCDHCMKVREACAASR